MDTNDPQSTRPEAEATPLFPTGAELQQPQLLDPHAEPRSIGALTMRERVDLNVSTLTTAELRELLRHLSADWRSHLNQGRPADVIDHQTIAARRELARRAGQL